MFLTVTGKVNFRPVPGEAFVPWREAERKLHGLRAGQFLWREWHHYIVTWTAYLAAPANFARNPTILYYAPKVNYFIVVYCLNLQCF